MSKHTPEPWKVRLSKYDCGLGKGCCNPTVGVTSNGDKSQDKYSCLGHDNCNWAAVEGPEFYTGETDRPYFLDRTYMSLKDAQLFAAAPETLEALKSCVVELSYLIEQTKSRKGGSVDRAFQLAKSAIAKAEGGA